MDRLGAEKGTYVLVMRLPGRSSLAIGGLGICEFNAGYYLYVGSALGPGGLRARLLRHARRDKRRHWHIDYLLDAAELLEIWISVSDERRECHLAHASAALPGGSVPVSRFGASDCRCQAHLVAFQQRPDLESLAESVPWFALAQVPGPDSAPGPGQ